jgi:arylsulfatase A-like enzyme
VSEQVIMSMDWMPTFVSMAGGTIDPAYPTDGIDLTAALKSAPPVSRKVFWSYLQNEQEAMRDGNMKWLKINENQFLFDVVKDPLERANLSRKQPEVFSRMASDYAEWNTTMLDKHMVGNSYHFESNQLADHYSPTPAAAKGKQKGGAGAAKGKGK